MASAAASALEAELGADVLHDRGAGGGDVELSQGAADGAGGVDAAEHDVGVGERRAYGKRTHIDEFRVQNRGGKGIILIDASDRNGPVVDVMLVREKDEIMVMTDRGQSLRTRAWEVRETGRNAQGVKIMAVDGEERIVAVERMAESAEVEGDGGPDGEAGAASEAGGPTSTDVNGTGNGTNGDGGGSGGLLN